MESEGAVAVFSEQFTNPDGSPAVLIVRKSDGGYGYGATDLASIRYRIDDLHADRLIYITDARQSQHFQMVFAAADRAGWTGDRPPEHIWFGTMLGEDGKPFKTRSGGTIRLSDLLDEAVERARAVVDAKSPELPVDERAATANAVGIGAVKYADLSTSRQRDLLFSFDRMLALDGNTAPYLLYACVRAGAIGVRAGETSTEVTVLAEPQERALVVKLSAFADVLAEVETRSSRTASATTSTSSPARTPRSTRPARCSRRRTTRRAGPGSRSARSPRTRSRPASGCSASPCRRVCELFDTRAEPGASRCRRAIHGRRRR